MQSNTKPIKAKEEVLNRGIEVMLPRGRRVEKPSWFDGTLHLLKWVVRVRIDVRRDT